MDLECLVLRKNDSTDCLTHIGRALADVLCELLGIELDGLDAKIDGELVCGGGCMAAVAAHRGAASASGACCCGGGGPVVSMG